MNNATQEPRTAPECFVADDERLVRVVSPEVV